MALAQPSAMALPTPTEHGATPPAHRAKPYLFASVGILVAGCLYELFRLFVPWPRVPYYNSASVSSLLIVVWSLSIFALMAHRRTGRLAKMAWVLSFAAPFLMVMHGMMSRIVTASHWGLFYVPAGAALTFCLKRMWDGTELDRARRLVLNIPRRRTLRAHT